MKSRIGKWIVVLGVLVAIGWSGSAMAASAHDNHGAAPAVKAEGGAVQAPAGKDETAAPPAEAAKSCKKCKQGMKVESGAATAKPGEQAAPADKSHNPVKS